MKRTILLLICVIGSSPGLSALAQQTTAQADDLAAMKKQMQEMQRQFEVERSSHKAEMDEMRLKVADLSAQVAASSQPDSSLKDIESALLLEQAKAEIAKTEKASAGIMSFNPDISLVGDFQARHDSNKKGVVSDKRFVKELELGIAGNIDPYARFTGIFSVHPKEDADTGYDIEVEEAYLEPLSPLYDGVGGKLGKFRANFGKVNELHAHALPWPDYPLVIQKMFGDEGLAGEGASVSWLAPGDKYFEVTSQSITKSKDKLLGGDDSDSFVQLLHAKTFRDLSKESTLEWGLSGAVLPNSNSPGGGNVFVEGTDLTYKWRPRKEGLYKSFTWINEFLASQREVDGRPVNAFGLYSAPEYQFARRWSAGARYDFSQDPDDSSRMTHAGGVYLTFKQSEFCFWRLGYQLSHTNFPVNGSEIDHTIMLQLDFSLGPHPAHKY